MSYTLITIFSFSILIPVLIGCIRLKKMDTAYLPIFLLLVAGLLHEVISFFLITSGKSNTIVYNLFTLVEVNLLLWQFANWKTITSRRWPYFFCMALLSGAWILINLGPPEILASINSLFLIGFSLLVVILSISQVNRLLVQVTSHILRHPAFLICLALVVFFTYAIVVEIFWLYGIGSSGQFAARVYDIMAVINLIANLVFALAMLWTPKKQKFILQS